MHVFDRIDQFQEHRAALRDRIRRARERDRVLAKAIERGADRPGVEAYRSERARLRVEIDEALERLVDVERDLRVLRHTPLTGRPR